MQKFRLLIGLVNVGLYFPCLDGWIGFVLENEVKELNLDVQTDIETTRVLFPAKWVTTLKLSGCKLKLSSDTLKLHSLRSLALVEVRVNREMIQKLVSECLLLEELSMAIDVDTPNLLYFSFVNNPIPVSSMNAPRLRKVELGKSDPDTRWYLDVKEFLVGVSNQIDDLTLCFMSKWMSFNVEEFRKSSTLVPCEVGNLCLRKIEPPSSLPSFLDGIFWIFREVGTLSMEAWNENDNFFIKDMLNRDVGCCHSHHIKCWRHYLKDFKIDNFLTFKDKKLLSRDDLMEVWPRLPTDHRFTDF
ncbi:hypothetical protein QYF36_018925 [Acer negundo]|nr:hypothetical protein QYF36_018925 [Acer negundo]